MKIRNLIICLVAVAVFSVPAIAGDPGDFCVTRIEAACGDSPSVDPCDGGQGGFLGGSCTSGDADPASYISFVAEGTTAQIKTDLSTGGTDSHFVVYSVDQLDICDMEDWVEIACSEDECNTPDTCDAGAISVWLGKTSVCGLTDGDTYMIQVGGWGGSCGPFVVDIVCPNKGSACGDGVIDDCNEECDGAALGSCDFGCNPDCTCSGRPSVPMLPNWGLAGLGLLLLAGGAMVFGRRRTATA